MISSFWNLCRACPSLPVEKLHSEYRSTFQWHEYVGSKNNSTLVNHAVVKQPTQSSKTQAFWSGGHPGGEERRGKRVHIANINNAGVNEWWLKSSSSSNPDRSSTRPQSQAQIRKLETQLPSESGGPKKSVSMCTFRALEPSFPQTHYYHNAETTVIGTEPRINMESSTKGPDSLEWTENKGMSSSYEAPNSSDNARITRKEYKSEYKKQFRPFSQYEYVDGRFFKKKGDQEMGGVNPWYKEVIELRQKAGEYRFRGWGTEFIPTHSSDSQSVWDQVSKQPSLAALALMTTTTKKSISKEEKEKENARKSLPKRSLSRPNTATPKHPLSESKMKDSETVQGAKKKYDGPPSTASGRASRGKARSQSAGPGGRLSPRKTTTHHSAVSKEREQILDQPQRHPRPTTLTTSPRPKASSDQGHRKTLQFQSSANSLGFSEPVIKSPPEPTRVKSPEQVILRSPDPVNWTVPLDTTKSFTVTQNIRDAPPSPRFRAGDRPDSSNRSIPPHQQWSGAQSSAASTKTSSPSISSFSPRSAGLAQKSKPSGGVSSSSVTTKSNQPLPPQQQKPTSGKSPHQPVLVPGGDNKKSDSAKPMRSTPFNLNGSENITQASRTTMKSPPAKLDNQKPDDNTNNNYNRKPIQPKLPAPMKPTPAADLRKPVPGTTLQCLEDPQFMFDTVPKSGTTAPSYGNKPPTVPIAGTHNVTTKGVTSPPPIAAPRGAIRVLEAPSSSSVPPTGFVPPAPVAVSSTAKRPGGTVSDSLPTSPPSQQPPGSKLPSYKVLDAPDPSEMYKSTIVPSTSTSTSGPTTTTAAATSSPSTSSTGGKSKHKFDFKFWKKDNEK